MGGGQQSAAGAVVWPPPAQGCRGRADREGESPEGNLGAAVVVSFYFPTISSCFSFFKFFTVALLQTPPFPPSYVLNNAPNTIFIHKVGPRPESLGSGLVSSRAPV